MSVHSDEPQIIGVALVRNEEFFSPWAIMNVRDFCDEIIVIDNMSTDRTGEIARALASRHPHITYTQIEDANRSHALIERFVGGNFWLLGVDGDDIYDPQGLARLRPQIKAGQYRHVWQIRGHTIHAEVFDLDRLQVRGFGSPPAKSAARLFNFAALKSWHEPRRERLHGRHKVFLPPWRGQPALELQRQTTWEECSFRSLHLCFFPRSRQDTNEPRKNPFQHRVTRILSGGIGNLVDMRWLFRRTRSYKNARYRKGPVVSGDAQSFGRPSDFASVSPLAAEAEAVLRQGAVY